MLFMAVPSTFFLSRYRPEETEIAQEEQQEVLACGLLPLCDRQDKQQRPTQDASRTGDHLKIDSVLTVS